jgi:hypothetical protein
MKLTEKLKDVMSPEDLIELESGIKTMVNEQVALRVEEKTIELEKKAEEFCEQEIRNKVAEEKEALIETYEKKMEDLENNMVEKLDNFLDSVITEQISEESIKKIALNETYEPIIKGIQDLFESKYVAIDSNGEKLVKEQKETVRQLRNENSTLIKEKMELSELAEAGAVKLIISEKTDGLTETQKTRVKNFCENKTFDEVERQIDSFIDLVEGKEDDDEEVLDEKVESNNSDKDAGNAEDELNENKKEDKPEDTLNENEDVYGGVINSANKFL